MSLIVEVKQGKLQGKESTSVLNGQKYYSFLGIPYAKPPIGELRFKAPEPLGKWEGTYDATYERDSCFQKDYFITTGYVGSEDCLFINVHTPEVPAEIEVPKAVMVFLHGGGFFTGSATERVYSADFLITKDVIFVEMNYRLHVFGFLNLGIPDCPGNAGLKDQAFALKWIKENIKQFGGDPDNVTLFGESAGASSVHFQIISPQTKGLFHKAIIQSGSALVPWALTYDYQDMAKELAQRLGFTGGTAQELLQFLKKQTTNDLTYVTMEMHEDLKTRFPGRCTSIPFSPSIEEIKEGALLPELPEKLLENTAPLPLIYGTNNKEGLLLYKALAQNILELAKEDFSIILKSNFKIDPAVLPTVSEKVKQYYFGDKEVGVETAEQLTDLYTDIYFYQMYEAIDFATKSSIPPYIYEFCYDGSLNMFKKFIMHDSKIKIPGASHGDELSYIFYPKMIPQTSPIVGDDLAVIQNTITLWTNFAKTGNPSDELNWTPSTWQQPRYLQIDSTLTLIDGKVYGKRLQFLKDLLGPVAKPYDIF